MKFFELINIIKGGDDERYQSEPTKLYEKTEKFIKKFFRVSDLEKLHDLWDYSDCFNDIEIQNKNFSRLQEFPIYREISQYIFLFYFSPKKEKTVQDFILSIPNSQKYNKDEICYLIFVSALLGIIEIKSLNDSNTILPDILERILENSDKTVKKQKISYETMNNYYLTIPEEADDFYKFQMFLETNKLLNELNKKQKEVNNQIKNNSREIKGFYSHILEIISILIAIFSIIGINIYNVSNSSFLSIKEMVVINSSTVFVISCLLFLVYFISSGLEQKHFFKKIPVFLIPIFLSCFLLLVFYFNIFNF